MHGAEAHRADAQVVRGQRVRGLQVLAPDRGRVETEVARDAVELRLEGEPRLRRAVAALGPARRLVREDARALELVRRDAVRDRLQRSRVVGRGDPVRAVAAAVERRLEVERGDRAVLLHAGPHPHQGRVTAPVAVEDLLARQADLDGPARDAREVRDDDLVVEDVRLAAEAAAVRRRDHADAGRRHREHLRERPVHVVRRLRRGPERELPVGTEVGDRSVLLEGEMGVAFVEVDVVVDAVRPGETLVEVAELHRDELVDVSGVAVVVNGHGRRGEPLVDRADRRERLVLDPDEIERVERRVLADGGDRRDRIADVAHAVLAERVLVLRDGQDAEGDGQVLSRRHHDDAGRGERRRDVDREDPRVRDLRAQELAVQHPRQHQVVGELRLPGDLRRAIDLRERTADDAGGLAGGHSRFSDS